MSLELERFLLNSYTPVPNKEVKDATNRRYSFRIDDLRGSEGPTFCRIYVKVTGLDRFLLHLTDSPMNHEIEQRVKSKKGKILTEHPHCRVSLTLETMDFQFIFQLSELIRDIPGPTRRYSGQDYEWVCSGTAVSLYRFAALLKQYEKQTRGIEKTRPDGLFAF